MQVFSAITHHTTTTNNTNNLHNRYFFLAKREYILLFGFDSVPTQRSDRLGSEETLNQKFIQLYQDPSQLILDIPKCEIQFHAQKDENCFGNHPTIHPRTLKIYKEHSFALLRIFRSRSSPSMQWAGMIQSLDRS